VIQSILAFWFADGRDTSRPIWFKRDEAFDAAIREQFGSLLVPAREGALDGWAETAEGALALILVLDQFSRNLHRGSPEAFDGDPHARDLARDIVLARRLDLALTRTERVFLYLPFEHSEAIADQDLSVALFEGLRDSPDHRAPGRTIEYAWAHRAVILRFGRFPHRNAVLGRENTAEEAAYLAQPGAGF
jgi:uncharacterized protein (DUF924 family)